MQARVLKWALAEFDSRRLHPFSTYVSSSWLIRPAPFSEFGQDLADRSRVAADGKVCIAVPPTAEYHVTRLRIRRAGDERPVMQVHHKGGPDARILGIIRVE